MKRTFLLSVAALLFFFSFSVSAQTIYYVKPNGIGTGLSWIDASGDLQMTINNSLPDDQIWVAAGTYKPKYRADNMSGADANDRDNAFVLKKDVKIFGGFVGNETTLDSRDSTRETNNTILSGDLGTSGDISDNAYHVVISVGDIGTGELNSFTITDGNGNGNSYITIYSKAVYRLSGGGIFISYSSPTFSNITIWKNNATMGGGISNESSTATISNTIISENNTNNGDGGGIYNENSSPVIYNVLISGNKADYNNDGGGIYNNNNSSPILTKVTISGNLARSGAGVFNMGSSSPILKEVIISGNNASDMGGGMVNSTNSIPSLTNVIISGNKAISFGGGIYNTNGSNPNITNVIIRGNLASIGSAISNNSNSSPILTNVSITGNYASDRGGGMFNFDNCNPILTNVTISGNKDVQGGGAISNFGLSSSQIRNSIIYGNSTGIENDGSSNSGISYSLVQGLSNTSNGNIDGSSDPKFLVPIDFNSSPSIDGDYRVTDNSSPTINKGNNTYFDAGQSPNLHSIITDLDGNPRIYDGIVDMGAYESQSTVPITLVNYTAKAEGKQALLKWTTATENNNKEYVVMHSTDGKNFTEIGKVTAAGNSSMMKDYFFYDRNPSLGINYYSLSQIDFDGKTIQLGVRTVNFSIANTNVINVYPNPVRNMALVEFTANQFHQLELTDINGKVLQRIALSNFDSQKKVDMGSLSAGIYFIKLIGNTGVESRKVVKE
jgi:hypothetical protein